ncbi:MAG: PLP-dependent transferase, partial [Paracoccaceae bacterium]
SAECLVDFVNQRKIIKIGMSWGGVNSLAVVYPDLQRPNQDFGGRIVRLNIGLERVEDLKDDLSQAIAKAC